jgi:hypothetical protein
MNQFFVFIILFLIAFSNSTQLTFVVYDDSKCLNNIMYSVFWNDGCQPMFQDTTPNYSQVTSCTETQGSYMISSSSSFSTTPTTITFPTGN